MRTTPYGGYTSSPANAIALQYANAGWVPLCDDYGGNHIGIDLAPGPAGVRGQVISFGRDEEEKVVIAASLGDFLLWFATQLERGNFRIDRPDKDRIDFDIDRPNCGHFIDAVRTLFGSAQ